MKRRWLGWSMSTLLLACAGSTSVHETVAKPRVAPSAGTVRLMRTKADAPAPRKVTQRSKPEFERAREERTVAAKDVESLAQPSTPRTTPPAPPSLKVTSGARPDAEAERDERAVAIKGIEGTMSEYDVRATLDGKGQDFDRCHDTTGRSGSGRVSFRIRILPTGDVSDVDVRKSSVRDRSLVGCYADVILASKFPSPHGDYADVTWSTKVGRSRQRPDAWFERRVRWDAPTASSSDSSSRRQRRHSRR